MKQQRSRGQRAYVKPALVHDELLSRWRSRGMLVPDPQKALRCLQHVGYYRLSPYTIPFQQGSGGDVHSLRVGTTFDDVLSLYVFDRRLRLLVLDGLERIEVAVRAALTDYMAVAYSSPHWYENPELFADRNRHQKFLSIVDRMVAEHLSRPAELIDGPLNHVSALEHYVTVYAEPPRPPSWLMVEMLTIGQLDSLVSNLRERRDRTAIARSLGITEPVLLSWLRSYVRVRNVCAHHGRLWNLGLGVYPAIPKSAKVAWLADREFFANSPRAAKQLYPVLVSIQCVLSQISPRSSWAQRLSNLMTEYSHVPLKAMGIPHAWDEDPFWRKAIQAGNAGLS